MRPAAGPFGRRADFLKGAGQALRGLPEHGGMVPGLVGQVRADALHACTGAQHRDAAADGLGRGGLLRHLHQAAFRHQQRNGFAGVAVGGKGDAFGEIVPGRVEGKMQLFRSVAAPGAQVKGAVRLGDIAVHPDFV